MKIKNNKTHEELVFSNDWEVVEEKKKPKIKGQKYIDLFKHWAKANENINTEICKCRKQFVYNDKEDMLYYVGLFDSPSYGIGFNDFLALDGLRNGERYSYNELVGE